MEMTNKQKFAYVLYHILNKLGVAVGYTVTGLNWLVRKLFPVPYFMYGLADKVSDWQDLGYGKEMEEAVDPGSFEEESIDGDIHLAEVVNEDLPAALKKQAD